MKKILLILSLLAFNISVSANNIGINLGDTSYWTGTQPFINLIKSSTGWLTQTNTTWDTKEQANIPLDEDGYPTRLDGTGANGQPVSYTKLSLLMVRDLPAPHYPAGRYVFLYDGTGTFTAGMNATIVTSASVPGRLVLNVATATKSGILITLTSTDPANHARNFRLVRESLETAFTNGEDFTPEFLDLISFAKVYRYMDWTKTNNNTQIDWTDRALLHDITWNKVGVGVPYEVIAKLAAKTGTDVWLNVPHMATDDYITQMALIMRALLPVNTHVYLEYSNETWNNIFGQTAYVNTKGAETWPTSTATAFAKNRNYHGMRSAQMCNIWRTQWAADSGRVTCVMAMQAADVANASVALNCNLWSSAPCDRKHGITTLAIAPYFGKNNAYPANITIDEFFTILEQDDTLLRAYNNMSNYVGLARTRGLNLVAYEGGTSFIGSNPYFIPADSDSRMASLIGRYLDTWKHLTDDSLFMWFNSNAAPGTFGQFGLVTSIYAPRGLKYDAVVGRAGLGRAGQ